MAKTESKAEILRNIAKTVEKLVRDYGHRNDITITFKKLDEREDRDKFTPFQMRYFQLMECEEYFFIRDSEDLLYAVNVTGDSPLTAAWELMELVSKKF